MILDCNGDEIRVGDRVRQRYCWPECDPVRGVVVAIADGWLTLNSNDIDGDMVEAKDVELVPAEDE